MQGRYVYRLEPEGTRIVVTRRDGDAPPKPQYRFDLTPYEYADYEEMCRYHQTSADSHFTRNRICSLATREGRVTISGRRLIVTTDDWRREWELPSEKAYIEALRDRFGIVLNAA
jgi:N-hydroxyarylamine O-acetyltransferase